MSTIIKDQTLMMEEIKQLISEGKTVSISAKGYSMNPFIMHLRDQITLGPWTDDQIRKGAVVLAKDTRGCFVIHRIISVRDESVTLLGDGNIYGTETMPRDKVYGIIDCSALHLFFARIWLWMRPVRRYPLAIFRRITPR